MIVKNLERVQRCVVQLEAILETDNLDYYDRQYMLQAVASLSEICERHAIAKELGVDDSTSIEADA